MKECLVEDTQARGLIKSVDKTIEILQVLALEAEGLQLNEIATRLHINRSTVHHLLDTLKHRGFVDQNDHTGAYVLGYHFVGLALKFLSRIDLFSASNGRIRELRDRSGETAYLNVLKDRQIVSLIELAGNRPIQARISSSDDFDLHATSSGKLLLANLPEKQSLAILSSNPLTAFTPHTITDMVVLQKEMENIRQQGYALDQEEHIPGVLCIDAPVFNYQGECVASASLSYPAISNAERHKELLGFVVDTARSISHTLVYGSHSAENSAKRTVLSSSEE